MYRTTPVDAPLVVAVSGDAVVALDRRSGTPAWRFALARNNGRHVLAPRIWVENESVIVVSSSDMKRGWSNEVLGVVSCLDYRSGALRWQQAFDAHLNVTDFVTTVLVDQGQLLIATSNHVFAYSMENGAAQWVQALDGNAAPAGSTALAIPGISVQADRDR